MVKPSTNGGPLRPITQKRMFEKELPDGSPRSTIEPQKRQRYGFGSKAPRDQRHVLKTMFPFTKPVLFGFCYLFFEPQPCEEFRRKLPSPAGAAVQDASRLIEKKGGWAAGLSSGLPQNDVLSLNHTDV